MKKKKSIVKSSPKELQTSISSLNKPLANYIQSLGLPTENVLSPIAERSKVLTNLGETLELLPEEERIKSTYLTKFTVAISSGLFDGAINYLWDQTIKALRSLIVEFDLPYFFQIAETIASKYRNCSTVEDMEDISEHDLLEICRRIGVISDINFKRLEYVNYMRNHASAAHPNDNQVTGLEILTLLENCLRYAITAKPDHSVITMYQLIHNMRTQDIAETDVPLIESELAKQPTERIDDFLGSVFGNYCDPRIQTGLRSNIEKLVSGIWTCASEAKRYEIGGRYGYYRKNADTTRKNNAERFLALVDGLAYKDEDSLGVELLEKLSNLRSTHFEFNNFYNELPHAESLLSSLPLTGQIPMAAKHQFTKVVSICYAGNGKGYRDGVCTSAIPIYEKCIDLFTDSEIAIFVRLFSDPEFLTDAHQTTVQKRYRNLCEILRTKTRNVHLTRLLAFIIKEKDITVVHKLTDYQNLLKQIPRG
ncbi:hypothetical protein [Turneriella parva]|uniref:Uncharacterized protein n=1 Tax=Turneriella parva (strain ATCC BAA-1111 / DSM 21527 / NCTC 11395 / H) TaxID=869212 RepID=I4B9P2_TURPD|nr:hypothetical protein [Turneriella parva]AFM13999.1 hypothetical protein Turpa_3361 [Turneriella parva DSM 21527]